jgi:uncharacterized protein
MNNKMHPVVHFELPAGDMGRMKKFYETAFGWQMNQLGKDMGEYVVVTTTETDENRMIKEPGAINGGFYKKTASPAVGQHPTVVIAVKDIHEAMQKIKNSGGKVLGGNKGDGTPDDIPGIGTYASFVDTEGNRLSILQPKSMM